jgi:hypothetical protein
MQVEWSVSRPGRFTTGEIAPGTQWIGGWVGPRAGLDVMEKRKNVSPLMQMEPSFLDRPVRSLVTMWTELSRVLY